MENISIFAIFGFGIIILGILIYFMCTKNVSNRRIIFLSFLLMGIGLGAIFICLNHYLTLNQINKFKTEFMQENNIQIYKEIKYSSSEIDSISMYQEDSICIQ